jgi:hypothetical protein
MLILVASDREVLVIDVERGTSASAHGIDDRPTCLAADALVHGRAWCGTHRGGVFRSDDGGRSWQPIGLAGRLIMAVAASPAERDVVWAGTEPSEVWRSGDAGNSWEQTSRLETLSSSSEWSFPPKPDTHHVRWIACHPLDRERLWVAIEAGALVSTIDRGRTWRDRVPGGPWDTHELAHSPPGSRYTARLRRRRIFRELRQHGKISPGNFLGDWHRSPDYGGQRKEEVAPRAHGSLAWLQREAFLVESEPGSNWFFISRRSQRLKITRERPGVQPRKRPPTS